MKKLTWIAPALLALTTSLTASLSTAQTAAQNYPQKPIRMIVPFTPGGSTDILARSIGQELSKAWGQSVIIENIAGAGGSIGADKAAKSPADGYTLLMGHIGTLAVNPSLYPKLPYNPIKDFAPVAWVARVPNVLVVNPNVPAKSVQELVALAKSKPGQLSYGSGGNGSAANLATEYFNVKRSTQETPGHRTEGNKGCTQLFTSFENRNFGVACPQGILCLYRCNGMHGMGFA